MLLCNLQGSAVVAQLLPLLRFLQAAAHHASKPAELASRQALTQSGTAAGDAVCVVPAPDPGPSSPRVSASRLEGQPAATVQDAAVTVAASGAAARPSQGLASTAMGAASATGARQGPNQGSADSLEELYTVNIDTEEDTDEGDDAVMAG